jgi:transglutaminase-like putative cysteine protease
VPPAVRPGDGADPRVRIARDGTDLHALRGWTTGDGSAVHWRSTARRNVPVVVDRETPESTGLVVVAGGATAPESADSVVATVAGVALTAAVDGAQVHVVSSTGVLPLDRNDRNALLEWTAVAQPATADPDVADVAAQLAGPGGRVAVVHGRDAHDGTWAAVARARGVDVADYVVDAREVAPPQPTPVAPLDRPLALATLASLVGGVVCVMATGAVGGAGALATAVAFVAIAVVGLLRPPTDVDPRVRTALSITLLLLTGVLAVRFADPDSMNLAPAAVVGLCGVSAAQVVAARTRRDGLVALGLGPLMVIVAAGLAPGPALVLPALVVAVAVLLGLASCAETALLEGVSEAPAVAPTRPVVPALAVLALGLVAFLLLPLGSATSLGTSLLGERQTAPTAAQVAAQQEPSYFAGALDLASRAHLADTPALEVAPGSPALWRAMTLDTVYDGVWSTQLVQQELGTRDGRITLPTDPADDGAPRGVAQDYSVRPVDASSIVAPGAPVSVSGLGSVWQEQANGFMVIGALTPYTVSALPTENVDALSSSGSGPDRTDPVYVTPDDTTTPRTRDLATSIAAGATDRVAVVQAVEEWLRAHVRYQLDAPLPPSGQDAVDFLLFDSRAGFCEHFAAAETILLRSLGIPSRMATGYAVHSGVTGADGWTVVRDSDAHAWVEVWIPGHGWVSSDPTAGSALADATSDASIAQRALAAWTSLWSSDSGRRLLAVGVLAVVGLASFALVVVRRRRRADAGVDEAARRGAVPEPLAAFARLRVAMASDGAAHGPGDGVGEVRRAVQHDAELLGALDVVERTLYDRGKPGPEVRLAAAELLDRRTAALLARAAATRDTAHLAGSRS